MKNKSKYIKILLLVVVAVLFVLRGVHIYNVTNDKVADMYDSGFAVRQETAGLEKGMEINNACPKSSGSSGNVSGSPEYCN